MAVKQKTAQNSKFSDVDEYGFERPHDFDYATYEEFMSEYLSVLTRRARKWSQLLGAKETVGRSMKLKRYVRKGIPMKHRGKMWMTASGAHKRQQAHPNYYKSLLEGEKNEEVIEMINIDVPRTFPDNIYFKDYKQGKLASLKNVLVAFAHHNTNIGYCQGLNYIVGLLLIIVKDEENTFWLLNVLVEDLLPGYYTKDMLGVLTDIKALEELVRERKPLICKHLEYNQVDWGLVATKWFVCLFAEVLPVETVLRVWDCLFYEGNKILMRTAVCLVVSNQDKILQAHDIGALIECFKSITKDASTMNCHAFMEMIFKVPGSFGRSKLSKLRDECQKGVHAERI
ncbi:growth hormone-regulated TBC protein 1-A [Oratosquilla oratoria]|uniref:growth hormone-regulated TBC protein 1-A n=1 Tax=Oratosquilla oratoria TaxID=337810 RepID=UPI003F75B8C7